MKRLAFTLALPVSLIIACSSSSLPQATLSPQATLTIPPVPTISVQSGSTPGSTDTSIPSPSPTDLPESTQTPASTFPAELTLTPGIMETATAYSAKATAGYATDQALLGPMMDMFSIYQYFNPVGSPLQSWHDIPIMPQATVGQEFKSDIYSYKATVTLSLATQFYSGKNASLHWSCYGPGTGSAGTGSNATHSAAFNCQSFNIAIYSFDNDSNEVIVVINKAP